ncbi:MAG: hypothetical protein RRB13_06120 [bacterium]|nr:hypothetical protein [bacterium]
MLIKEKMPIQKKFTFKKAFAAFVIIFGLLTLKSGGSVLLFEESALAAGHYIPFIVWLNVLAVPFYLVAGLALWRNKGCTANLGLVLLTVYLLADGYLFFHILNGGLFEMRTVGAMFLRTLLWGGLYWVAKASGQACEIADQPAG